MRPQEGGNLAFQLAVDRDPVDAGCITTEYGSFSCHFSWAWINEDKVPSGHDGLLRRKRQVLGERECISCGFHIGVISRSIQQHRDLDAGKTRSIEQLTVTCGRLDSEFFVQIG